MRFELTKNSITAIREENDPKFYGRVNGAGESRLLYHIKVHLNNYGFDLIKKRMHKDGHLVDDLQQYLRTRWERSGTPHVMIYSGFWMIRGAEQDWNKGKVTLVMFTDAFEKQPDCVQRLKDVAERYPDLEWKGS